MIRSRYILTERRENMMKADVLAVGAHPDDIEITCAGTVIKLVQTGKKVAILDLTAGELGTRGSREMRREEAVQAAGLLGVSIRENLGIPDGNIEVNRENLLLLVGRIRSLRPDILLIPYGHDRHPDHEHAHRLCKEAIFYSGLAKIETLSGGAPQLPHRPLRFYQFMQWQEFQPSFIVDVSETWERRMSSMRAFKSQFYDPTSADPQTVLSTPDFFDFIETRAKFYGSQIGVRYGEPFRSEKPPGVKDLNALF
jgi:bacillithiol biosynthesis deacetylase BshB1